MADETGTATRYRLSFTTGALLLREAMIAAPLYLRERDWAKVRAVVEDGNLLQARTVESGRRLTREVVQRVAVLADEEIELLADATPTERGHLLWAAACRRYDLIGEFAEEVVRERFLLLTTTVNHSDFDSFVRRQAMWHEELTALKESTVQKLRSNLFLMLNEAGLLSADGHVLRAVLSQRVASVLTARTPSDMRFFPTSDDSGGSAGR